jgi:hypothetical protein
VAEDDVICEAFLDHTPGASVTLRFRNERAERIYLGSPSGCGGITPFSLRDEAGQEHAWDLGGCGFTCEALQTFSGACPADCAIPPVFQIEPGGHHDVIWDGRVLEPTDMPGRCYDDPQAAPSTCDRFVQAAGAYDVLGEAFPEAQGCAGPDMTCSCTPSAEGSCQLPSPASVAGAPLSATATLSYPDQTLIELVFQ